jgi:osmoprotectant transport system permease protein
MNWLTGAWDWLTDPANWSGPEGIASRLWQHTYISGIALLVAGLIALPIGLWLGHIGRGGGLAINISNIGRAIPTFAVLVLLVLPLGLERRTLATILALVLFALPPLLTNAYVGMREVDRDIVEAARGMGMTGRQLVTGVEIPLAIPVLMNGVRIAAVQVVATATIAAIVAGPGLGRIITAGFGLQDQDEIIAGAILVAAFALVVEALFALLQRALDPQERARKRSYGRDFDPSIGAVTDSRSSG